MRIYLSVMVAPDGAHEVPASLPIVSCDGPEEAKAKLDEAVSYFFVLRAADRPVPAGRAP